MTVPFIQPSFPNPPPSFPSSLSPTPLDARYAGYLNVKDVSGPQGAVMEQNPLFFCMRQWTTLDTCAVSPAAFDIYRTCIVQLTFLFCCCCCYILIYLPLCNLNTEFSSSELTLSRIESVLFLCFFVSTHKFSVVHDLRQMWGANS